MSPGERPLSPDDSPDLGTAIIAMHYSDVARKLNQPILAEALSLGFLTPPEIQFLATVWELQIGPYAGRRYIGGYYPSGDGSIRPRDHEGKITFLPEDPFRLDTGHATFLGLEETIFKQLVGVARGGPRLARQVNRSEEIFPFYSGVSMLKDGSVLGQLDFFSPVERVAL